MDSVDREWWINHSGEYVLGLLDDQDQLVLERVMVHEPEVEDMVAQWRAQFQPISDALTPIEPPAHIHDALFQQLPQRTRKLNANRSDGDSHDSDHVGVDDAQSGPGMTDSASVMQLLRTKQSQTDGWRSFAGIAVVVCLMMCLFLFGMR